MKDGSWRNGGIVGGWFNVDRGVEMIMIQVHIKIQKCDLGGGGISDEFDGVAAVEAFSQKIDLLWDCIKGSNSISTQL